MGRNYSVKKGSDFFQTHTALMATFSKNIFRKISTNHKIFQNLPFHKGSMRPILYWRVVFAMWADLEDFVPWSLSGRDLARAVRSFQTHWFLT